jgi:hypothetical protein
MKVRVEGLDRDELIALAHEHMLSGLLSVKAVTPLLFVGGDLPLEEQPLLSIDQWMGASPVYSARLKEAMAFDGDDVPTIFKALQLDVGFVHQYMDVKYQVNAQYDGEFWLPHCGALLDVEPFGEDMVFNMCHTIEDPTFDATALAHNPKARIRPIHRPPRIPVNRAPHCHWTLVIDDANDPVPPIPRTEEVRALALSSLPNERSGDRTDGRDDYTGEFDPSFRLNGLSTSALRALVTEFAVQTHLLIASNEFAIADRTDISTARRLQEDGWVSLSWILAERLMANLALGEGADAVASALALTAAIPPGFDRDLNVSGDHLSMTLIPRHAGLLDPEHPGWVGSLARGSATPYENTARGAGMEVTSTTVDVVDGVINVEMDLHAAPADRVEPDAVQLSRIGLAAGWRFALL